MKSGTNFSKNVTKFIWSVECEWPFQDGSIGGGHIQTGSKHYSQLNCVKKFEMFCHSSSRAYEFDSFPIGFVASHVKIRFEGDLGLLTMYKVSGE